MGRKRAHEVVKSTGDSRPGGGGVEAEGSLALSGCVSIASGSAVRAGRVGGRRGRMEAVGAGPVDPETSGASL